MAAGAWTYSDWITKTTGSTERLERLRLHIQEVSDKLKAGSYSVTGRSVQRYETERYLAGLRADEKIEAERTETTQGTRLGWSRGVAIE